jgi:hypothetical protein
VPHTSIAGTADHVVAPSDRARFEHGEHLVLEGRGHNGLLFDETAIDTVVRCILDARGA